MIFTIKPGLLLHLLESVPGCEWEKPNQPSAVRLQASCGRVHVKANGIVAEADAQVWDDGQCRVLAARLLEVVKRFQFEPGITVNVNGGFLRIRSAAVPVLSAGAWTATADSVPGDFATD
jgi:hypothetical protein